MKWLFQAGHDDWYDEPRSFRTIWNRFERSPAGWTVFAYFCSLTIIPALIFFYDLVNGHHGSDLYWEILMPFAWWPILTLGQCIISLL